MTAKVTGGGGRRQAAAAVTGGDDDGRQTRERQAGAVSRDREVAHPVGRRGSPESVLPKSMAPRMERATPAWMTDRQEEHTVGP